MSLATLRSQLAQVLDDTKPGTPALPTGIGALDAVLPGNGLPRGRLTELLGAPGCGKTTLVRRMVEGAMARGWWVAYVDASRTLAPREWASLGEREGLWMVRPRSAERGAWCADVLLRSGAFALVVLDGAPVLAREVAVRLTRLARESDAAFLVLGDDTKASALGGALRLRVARQMARASVRDTFGPRSDVAAHSLRDALGPRSIGASIAPRDALGPLRGPAAASRETTLAPPSPHVAAKEGARTARTDARATPALHIVASARAGEDTGVPGQWPRADAAREGHGPVPRPSDGSRPNSEHARIIVTIEKGGPYQTVSVGEVDRDIAVARRVRAHPEVPDRRGVARQQRRTPTVGERRDAEQHVVSTRNNARSRRCAEARLPDEPFLAAAVER
ncbi:MAG: hypothetical protein HY084_09975 [Gemmatimonadetes bacterium]|nr:hypothetical protein [Gemmatimonadota bacterium]